MVRLTSESKEWEDEEAPGFETSREAKTGVKVIVNKALILSRPGCPGLCSLWGG